MMRNTRMLRAAPVDVPHELGRGLGPRTTRSAQSLWLASEATAHPGRGIARAAGHPLWTASDREFTTRARFARTASLHAASDCDGAGHFDRGTSRSASRRQSEEKERSGRRRGGRLWWRTYTSSRSTTWRSAPELVVPCAESRESKGRERMLTTTTTSLDVLESGSAESSAADNQACPVKGSWPIGTVVSLYFVAHGGGPEPEPRDFIEAVNLGLIRLDDPWRVTERGEAILAEHGWL